jgi:hypothetical protein
MDYIKKTIAERLENAYKFECRCCENKFDTRTDYFISANYLTVWEKFPEGEMQMYCSKDCANEENWIYDFTEHNVLCKDCGNNCEDNGECFDCEIAPNIAEKAKCPECDGPDGDDCVPCMVKRDAKCPDSDFDKTYIVRCGSQRSFEYGDETIMYNGNDFPEAVRVFEELNGKYKSKYEWVELYDNETYAIIKMWDRDSEAYQEDKKGSRKVSKKFPPKTEKEIKERENKYAEVAAEVKEKYGKMTNKQLYEFLVENRKTVKTPKGQTKDVYLSALVALTMYGDLYKYRDSIGGFITLPKYRTA